MCVQFAGGLEVYYNGYRQIEEVTAITGMIGEETWWQAKLEADMAEPEMRAHPGNRGTWALNYPRILDKHRGEKLFRQECQRFSFVANRLS